jgi:hypothetical protein
MARLPYFSNFMVENLTSSWLEIYFITVSAVYDIPYVLTSFQFQNIYMLKWQDYDAL